MADCAESGMRDWYPWRCPRAAVVGGYCRQHAKKHGLTPPPAPDTAFAVKLEDGYVKVFRGSALICAGVPLPGGRVTEIAFMDDADLKKNRTRQAAMKALQAAGWK